MSLISCTDRRFRLNCRHRDSTVAGSFCGSVVANRNLTCGGGSSSVLSSALNELRAQHVHFVDQVDLVAAARRRVLHVVEQLARIIDLGARGRVDFDQIDAAPGLDFAAARALEAGFGADAALAVQALGEDARHRGLADAARAGEQEGVVHASALERIGQRTQHVLLAGHLGEAAWTPFARERCVCHRRLPRLSAVEAVRAGLDFGARRNRYRCSLPGLTGLAARRREGTGADHHDHLAERVGFEPTNTLADVTGIPVQRLRPLGHLSIQ